MPPFALPGFVNAHSHAFQRDLRGSVAGGDFWAWRGAMVDLARDQVPRHVRESYAAVYREMRRAGYTAVGEFHYLGVENGLAAVEAAADAGIQLVLLAAAYAVEPFGRGTIDDYLRELDDYRGRGVALGLAPHSVRACPPDWLDAIAEYADREGLVLHVHASEQPAEVEWCRDEYGATPIEHLARHGILGPRTTLVHATHATERELDLVAEAGARICICPTTEASLGDGFPPIGGICARGIGVCIGSDSNVRIDPLEELRELEGTARRLALRRNVISLDRLLAFGSDEGAASLGLQRWDDVAVDTAHPSLAGLPEGDLPGALVYGCSADVFATQ